MSFINAAAKTDAGVHLENRRRVHNARQLGIDSLLVFARQVVVVEHALGARGSAARVFHLDRIRPDLLQRLENVLLALHPDRHDQDDGGRTDDHAQSGQGKAQLGRAKAVERQLQDLAQQHGPARAEQRLLEGVLGELDRLDSCYRLRRDASELPLPVPAILRRTYPAKLDPR